ncbi:TetR/AcrR family transcriptional regulator [Nonomuraea soli]|uniref:AcrR family transcriptional regulator n=1 Tax=Nonomuraea soli TaxID=1032476 RepID=A0A7W0CT02_9ACTN|nr:TetR/AcrR family transcriptional regulator [Nonomuraea soli]MBA2896624.1 AcrR family transcriptional regulator [Nonomuraea soli]
MQISRRTQADRTAATRTALIAAGRRLFAEHGFAGVGTETIVRDADVSRGALYHHFGDKTELFAAVLADVEGEVTQQLAATIDADADFVTLMMRSVQAWLDACQRPEVQRIVLIDGPAVLGWARWREICQPHILGLIEGVLAVGVRDETLKELPVKPLAHVLLAVADEAALYVGASQEPEAARRDMEAVIRPLVEALLRR